MKYQDNQELIKEINELYKSTNANITCNSTIYCVIHVPKAKGMWRNAVRCLVRRADGKTLRESTIYLGTHSKTNAYLQGVLSAIEAPTLWYYEDTPCK